MSSSLEDPLHSILEFSHSDSSSNELSVNVSSVTDTHLSESSSREHRSLSNIAFTPGRTTLQKDSMLMLQKKFGSELSTRNENAENIPVQSGGFDSKVTSALSKVSAVRTPHKSSIPVLSQTPASIFATPSHPKGLRINDSLRNSGAVHASGTSTLSIPANDIDPSPTAASKIGRLQTPGKEGAEGRPTGIMKLSSIPVSTCKKKRLDRSGVVTFASNQDVILVDTLQPPMTPIAKSPMPGRRLALAGTTPFKDNDFQVNGYEDDQDEAMKSKSPLSNESLLAKNPCDIESAQITSMSSTSPHLLSKTKHEMDHPGMPKTDVEPIPLSPTSELNLFLAQLEQGKPSITENLEILNTSLVQEEDTTANHGASTPKSRIFEAMLSGKKVTPNESSLSSPDSDIERITRSSSGRKDSPTCAMRNSSCTSGDEQFLERYPCSRGVTPINFGSQSTHPTPSMDQKMSEVNIMQSTSTLLPCSTSSPRLNIGVQSLPYDSSHASECGPPTTTPGPSEHVISTIGEDIVRRRSDYIPPPQPSPSSPPRTLIEHQHDEEMPNRTETFQIDMTKSRIGSPSMQKGPGQVNLLGVRCSGRKQEQEKTATISCSSGKKERSFTKNSTNEFGGREEFEREHNQFNYNYEVYGVYDFEKDEDNVMMLHSSPHRSGLGPDILRSVENVTDSMPTGEHLSASNFEGISLQVPGLRRRRSTPQPSVIYPVEAVPFMMGSCEQASGGDRENAQADDNSTQSKEDLAATTDAVNYSSDNSMIFEDDNEIDWTDSRNLSTDMALSDLLGTPHVCIPINKSKVESKRTLCNQAGISPNLAALRVPCNHRIDDNDVSLLDDVISSNTACDSSNEHSFAVGEELLGSNIEDRQFYKDIAVQSVEDEQSARREDCCDISVDYSAITFDPPVIVKDNKRKLKTKSSKSTENKLVQMSKTEKDLSSVSADIKEVTIQGYVNKSTSASLTFENKKNTPMKLSAVVILVRVDELQVPEDTDHTSSLKIKASQEQESTGSPTKREKDTAFRLFPTSSNVIEPGKEMKLRITFKPSRFAFYSGVIKIKCAQKSYVVLLRGEALQVSPPVNFSHMSPPSKPCTSILRDNAFSTPGFKDYYRKRLVEDDRSLGVVSTSLVDGHAGCDDDYLILMQQKWVKHWIDKELTRSVSRSEVRYTSNASTGEKQYISKYEKWVESPHMEQMKKSLSRKIEFLPNNGQTCSINDNNDDVEVFPTTLNVDKFSGEATGNEVMTIKNSSSRPRIIRVESSSTVMMVGIPNKRELSEQSYEDQQKIVIVLQPFSNFRISLRIRREFLSSMEQGSCHDMGEIHWGYVVVSCDDTSQEIVVDIRSSDIYSPPVHTLLPDKDAPIYFKGKEEGPCHSRDAENLKLGTSLPNVSSTSRGLYFTKNCLDFGTVSVGSLKRAKATLCNATDEELVLFISDPELPYLVSHNEIKMKARSYIRLPVRMVPITANSQQPNSHLTVRSSCGKFESSITLRGNAL